MITAIWLAQDVRVQHFDPSRHLLTTLEFLDHVKAGDLLYPLTHWIGYPPAVHLTGMSGMLLGGESVWVAVMTVNLVFVPLLALGVYQTGRLVFHDSRAGLLAVAFALGTPLLISQFHVYMLDASETAMVALSVWLLLASRNFERPGYAAAAGGAVGVGLMTKQTFVWFLIGLVLVMLARGGWREWRGLVAFAVVATVIAAPWYVTQVDQLRSLAATSGSAHAINGPGTQAPARYSVENAEWYFWSGLNYQNRLPLFLFAAIGTVFAVVRLVRGDRGHPLLLELLVGGFVGWAGITWTMSHEPRYSMPLLVYMAVLGTGWILFVGKTGRIVAISLFAIVCVTNVLGASYGLGPRLQISLPGAPDRSQSYVQEDRITLYTHDGFVFGEPVRGGDLLPLLRTLHDRGVRQIQWDQRLGDTAPFNVGGLMVLARFAGMGSLSYNYVRPNYPDEALIVNKRISSGSRPCERFEDGSGVWIYVGRPGGRLVDACPHDRPA